MEIFVHREPWQKNIRLVMKDGNAFATSIVMGELENGAMIPLDVCPVLDGNAAQVLVDELWRAGFRPSEAMGSAGSMRATEKHLDDMRKIVSKNLKVDL